MKISIKQILTLLYLFLIFLVLLSDIDVKFILLLVMSLFYFIYNIIKGIIYIDINKQTSIIHLLLAVFSISFFCKVLYYYYNFLIHIIVIILSIYLVKVLCDIKKWKNSYLIIGLNILLLLTSNDWIFRQVQSKNKKNWNRELKWSEFQGNPEVSSKMDAIITTGFNYKVNRLYNYPSALVTSFMNKQDSWKKETTYTKELLNHEQGHFDITEAYARFTRDSIKNSWGKNPKEIEEIIDYFLEQKNKMQGKYDTDTQHGLIYKNQKEWNDKFTKWLE